VVLVFVFGMAVLIFMSVQAYRYAPPIPESVVDSAGKVIFNRQDIESGQEVFLKYALMQNGSIWGHGSYLGPDFSATPTCSLWQCDRPAGAQTDLAGSEDQRSVEARVAKFQRKPLILLRAD
jgi:nitric oxide reductase large subunit